MLLEVEKFVANFVLKCGCSQHAAVALEGRLIAPQRSAALSHDGEFVLKNLIGQNTVSGPVHIGRGLPVDIALDSDASTLGHILHISEHPSQTHVKHLRTSVRHEIVVDLHRPAETTHQPPERVRLATVLLLHGEDDVHRSAASGVLGLAHRLLVEEMQEVRCLRGLLGLHDGVGLTHRAHLGLAVFRRHESVVNEDLLIVELFLRGESLERLGDLFVAVADDDNEEFVVAKVEPLVLAQLLMVAHDTLHGELELGLIFVVHGDTGHDAWSLTLGLQIGFDRLQNATVKDVA